MSKKQKRTLNPLRILALSLTLAIHAGIGIGLWLVEGSDPRVDATAPETALQVTFIDRKPLVRARVKPPTAVISSPRSHVLAKMTRQAKAAPLPVPAVAPLSTRVAPPIPVAQSVATPTMDYRPQADPIRYERNVLTRPKELAEDASSHLHVQFHDSSIGGVLDAMTKRSTCGDLHAALAAHPESAAAIRVSMERIRCGV